MKLKYSNKNKTIFKNKKIIISIILLCLYTGAMVFSGAHLHRSGFFGKTKKAILLRHKMVSRYVKGLLANPDTIYIDVKYKNFQKLAKKREAALARGLLIKSPDDYVPATIRHQDKSVRVDVRLKGDLPDNFDTQKWSFRIRTKRDDSLFGMKYFSIQHPKTRGYIEEWLFHKALEREGIIALRYKFIDVVLNGKPLGIYALEEFFDKCLIEHNELRDGPIIRFNENMFFTNYYKQEFSECASYLSSDIDAFHTNKVLSDPLIYSQFTKATNLLESFRKGDLKTRDVFDTQKLAKFFAIGDLTGSTHGMYWNNDRFYYNPITSRLEPIGFDGNDQYNKVPITTLHGIKGGVYIENSNAKIIDNFNAMIFNDELFFRQYMAALRRISDPAYLDKLFDEVTDEMTKNLNILYREFPLYDFSKELLYKNQECIRTFLDPLKGMHAYYRSTTRDSIELELGNIQSIPIIEVLNLSYKDFIFYPAQKTMLPGKIPSEPVHYQKVSFLLPEDFAWSDTMIPDLKVNYKLFGMNKERYEPVFPWPYLDVNFIKADFIRQDPNIYEFNFLTVDETAKKIFIKPGIWSLDQNLIIPQGYKIICTEGTQIDLSDSAKIFSRSPLEFIGTQENPVLIHSEDGSGQGIVIVNASQKSLLKYAVFDNLSNPSQNGWELTGAVTFYESPVEVSDCRFSNNKSEDSLNIIRSEFTINNTIFSQTFSDALDADFCKGEITNSFFINSGNDAIDVSGSTIELKNIFINNTGDKGISAGENSEVTIGQVEIKNAVLAAASKDMSNIDIYKIKIIDSKVGLAVYQKKSEFGPARLNVTLLEKQNVSKLYLLETSSSLVIAQSPLAPNQENVFEYLYGGKE